jgi:hypothetical protein
MSYTLTIEATAGYLHAVITGRNSRENVQAYQQEVLRECLARGCGRVLIEERLEGPRLGPGDVFDIAAEGAARGATALPAIAYVDVNAQGALMKFAEDVAVNRGVRVRVSGTLAEAQRWLLQLS